MKLNNGQIQAIRQYLSDHLKYRETKDELFDHILTALEDIPDSTSFGVAMNQVIGDLGGLKEIAVIERAAKWVAFRALVKSYIEIIIQVFRSPIIMIGIISALVIFCLVGSFWFNYRLYPLVLICNTPSIVTKRNIMAASNIIHVKNSAFKVLFSVLYVMIPGLMFLSTWLTHLFFSSSYQAILPYSYTAVFLLTSLNAVVLYKLTRNEFRVEIAAI